MTILSSNFLKIWKKNPKYSERSLWEMSCHVNGSLIKVHNVKGKKVKVKVKWSRYRPSVAQRVGRGIALLFHDRGTRRGWVVSSTSRPLFTPWRDPVPILQETGWSPGPIWTGGKSRSHRDSIPDRPARGQSIVLEVNLENRELNGYILFPTTQV